MKLASLMALTTAISMLLITVFFSISMKQFSNKSPFECGFTPMEESRTPLSSQFFQIALIFLIFDIELILLFPFILTLIAGFSTYNFMLATFFFTALTLGLFFEWMNKMIIWTA